MPEPAVWVFFYGSYINMDVVRERNIVLRDAKWRVSLVLTFASDPVRTLSALPSIAFTTFWATGTHAELSRLYAHAKDVLGETYLPEAVLAETLEGSWKPALCYVCPAMVPRPATNDYIDRIVTPARKYGFPTWYLERLESFRPKS